MKDLVKCTGERQGVIEVSILLSTGKAASEQRMEMISHGKGVILKLPE